MFNRKLRRATVNGFFRHSENADLNRNGQIANIDVKQETLPFKITVANERLGLANKQLHRFDLEIDISPSRMHRQVARWLCHFSAFFCRPNSVFFFADLSERLCANQNKDKIHWTWLILPFNTFPDFYFSIIRVVCIWVNWIGCDSICERTLSFLLRECMPRTMWQHYLRSRQ